MYSNRSSLFTNIPPVTKNLLIINVLVFIAGYALETIGIDITSMFALHNVQSPEFRPHQFVTHMFMHGGFSHLFFNMFALFMFGRMLEMVWSGKRFLIYYLITGLGAAALHSFVNYLSLKSMHTDMMTFLNTPSPDIFMTFVREYLPNAPGELNEFISSYSMNPNNASYLNQATELVDNIYIINIGMPTVGASGAIFGVLLAFGMLFPNTELMLLFPPIPIKAKYFVMGYGAIELFAVIMPGRGDNIAHFAHLGGMLFGYILIKYWSSKGIGKYDKF